MRTKNFLQHLILGALLLSAGKVVGQSTTPGNVAGAGTDFLGWNNNGANNFPLRVRHDGNWPIEWYTDARRRMQLYQTLNNVSLNGFNGLNHSGYLGLSGNPAFFTFSLPFSRLHLADTSQFTGINAQALGFRPWQRNGITFTGNGDHGYFGQEHNGQDTTDMVLAWSNDFGIDEFSPDHLSIRFISNRTTAASGANSMKGLEAMRFFPVDRERVNVGIGDWFAGNISDPSITEPAEILDVLDGRVRIRQLPTEDVMDSVVKVVAVNEDGVLGWLDASGVPTQDEVWLTQGNDNIIAGTHFLGTTTTAPLDIRTDSIQRMRLWNACCA
jgi:uncharacterized protein (UPF0297 family)